MLRKRKLIFFIFLFLTQVSFVVGQSIMIYNNSNKERRINYNKDSHKLMANEKIEIPSIIGHNILDIYDKFTYQEGIRLDVFTFANESIRVEIIEDSISIDGDGTPINKFVDELTKLTFWKVNDFSKIIKESPPQVAAVKLNAYYNELINKALKVDHLIFKKFPVINNIILNKFLSTLSFSGTKDQKKKNEVIKILFTIHLQKEYSNYNCIDQNYSYPIIEYLAKINDSMNLGLKEYSLPQTINDPPFLKYMPPNCQRAFFVQKLNYFRGKRDDEAKKYEEILKKNFIIESK